MSESTYVPTRFNPHKQEWEPIHKERSSPYMSPGYPGWICKNGCGTKWPENTPIKKCPKCEAPLIRWLKCEQKI